MGIKGKYIPLMLFLSACGKDSISLTVEEISNHVEGGLPPWVYNPKYNPWSTSANPVGPMSKAWLDAGYVVDSFDSPQNLVTFKKK